MKEVFMLENQGLRPITVKELIIGPVSESKSDKTTNLYYWLYHQIKKLKPESKDSRNKVTDNLISLDKMPQNCYWQGQYGAFAIQNCTNGFKIQPKQSVKIAISYAPNMKYQAAKAKITFVTAAGQNSFDWVVSAYLPKKFHNYYHDAYDYLYETEGSLKLSKQKQNLDLSVVLADELRHLDADQNDDSFNYDFLEACQAAVPPLPLEETMQKMAFAVFMVSVVCLASLAYLDSHWWVFRMDADNPEEMQELQTPISKIMLMFYPVVSTLNAIYAVLTKYMIKFLIYFFVTDPESRRKITEQSKKIVPPTMQKPLSLNIKKDEETVVDGKKPELDSEISPKSEIFSVPESAPVLSQKKSNLPAEKPAKKSKNQRKRVKRNSTTEKEDSVLEIPQAEVEAHEDPSQGFTEVSGKKNFVQDHRSRASSATVGPNNSITSSKKSNKNRNSSNGSENKKSALEKIVAKNNGNSIPVGVIKPIQAKKSSSKASSSNRTQVTKTQTLDPFKGVLGVLFWLG